MASIQPQPRGYRPVDQGKRLIYVRRRMTGHRTIGSRARIARVRVVGALCAIVAGLENGGSGGVCGQTRFRCWDDDYVRQPRRSLSEHKVGYRILLSVVIPNLKGNEEALWNNLLTTIRTIRFLHGEYPRRPWTATRSVANAIQNLLDVFEVGVRP